MKLGNNILAIVLFIIIGIPIFILFLPVMIVLYPIRYFQRKRFEKKYAEFLSENSGKNFFCYNNRKKSKKYIEDKIIPRLTGEVEIVYLNGKKVESDYKAEFISEALYKLKTYSGFPHLMKIRDGKLIDKSINNPFYNVLNMNQPKDKLLIKIHGFFELAQINNLDKTLSQKP
ncbi:MAG: hypothetical protein OIF50_15040 [Flavobacteriaceae bacterium]|nr:hypothetical protein [Flavobacteriaceae bacterium]